MSSQKPISNLRVFILFFLSGMAGLMYEILWVNRFGRLMGNSSYATGTVLAAYMGGLGLGSFLIGRVADRWRNLLRAYAILEIMIGGLALMVGPLLFLLSPLYIYIASFFNPAATAVSRMVVSIAVMLPPTICMGATLPILVKYCSRSGGEGGLKLGQLYAVNTLGAVLGVLGAGFYFLPIHGEWVTLLAAFAINVTVCVFAWVWSSSLKQKAIVGTTPSRTESVAFIYNRKVILSLAAIFITGFAAMSMQVAWSRVISLMLGSSVFSFTAMLAILLAGIGMGGELGNILMRLNKNRRMIFIWSQLLLCIWLLVTVPHYDSFADIVGLLNTYFIGQFSWIMLFIAVACIAMLLLPALCMGISIPVVMSIVSSGSDEAKCTGLVYASNTFGGICGSLFAGFLLLPFLGVINIYLISMSLTLIAVFLVLMQEFRPNALHYAIMAILMVVAIGIFSIESWDPLKIGMGSYMYGPSKDFDGEIVFYEDGVSGTVTVEKYPNDVRTLRVNGKADASTELDMSNQLMTGHLGMFHNVTATNVLVVGYGSGVSVGAVLQYDVNTVHCAELERRVIEADPWFNTVNHKPLDDDRLSVYVEDGRNIVNVSPLTYDVIVSEPSNPWIAGIDNLFSRDYYEACKEQMAEDGVMCQWLQAYGTSLSDFKLIMRTFASVFDYHAMYRVSSGDYLLIGSATNVKPDLEGIQALIERVPEMKHDFIRYCSASTAKALILRYFIFDTEDYDNFCGIDGRILKDSHNTLGYSAARNLFTTTKESVQEITSAVYAHKKSLWPSELTIEYAESEVHELSAVMLDVGARCIAAGNIELAEDAYRRAVEFDPMNTWALSELMKINWIKGDSVSSEMIKRVVDGNPGIAYNLCRYLFSVKQYDVAQTILDLLADKYPESSTLMIKLALSHINMGNIDKGITMLNEQRQRDPLNEEITRSLEMIQQLYIRQ